MPTGYTADVADGKITDLEGFALLVARGMGALVSMRDEPLSVPIPDKFHPFSYYKDRLSELKEERERISKMTTKQCEEEVQRLTDEYYRNEAEAKAKHEQTRQRYLDMIAKVEAWKNPPEGIRKFALDQLKMSLDFDCREPFKYYGVLPDADPENWRETKLEQLEKDILFYAEEYSKECDRVNARNAWLAQLRESLK